MRASDSIARTCSHCRVVVARADDEQRGELPCPDGGNDKTSVILELRRLLDLNGKLRGGRTGEVTTSESGRVVPT